MLLAGCGGGNPSGQALTGTFSAATLAWDAPNEIMSDACINVASYQIAYGTSPTNLNETATVPAGSVSCANTSTSNACRPAQSCTYSISSLSSGTWSFVVQVADTARQQSGGSTLAGINLP